MKILLSATLLTFLTITAAAQSGTIADRGCATPPASAEELQSIYDWSSVAAAAKTTAGTDTIPLTVHIVGNSAGTGYYSLATLWKVLCNTNERFQPAGIYFHLKWPINYINNSSYYVHNNSNGFQMMQQNNVANTVNVYFVNDPAGACGYFSPGADGIAIANGCAGVNSTTLTHELGHFLGLPHTFSGWENGNIPSNPELVTRGSGANCSSTGDGFCDTEADYLGARWNCPYTGVKYDANNNLYHPDSSVYMSYSTDDCMTRFTPQQIARMQNRLATQPNRVNLLAYNSLPYTTLDTPAMSYPVDSMFANDRTIRWTAVPGAQYYHVIITRTVSGIVLEDTLMTGISLETVHTVVDYNRYTVRITPLATSNVCAEKARVRTYYYSPNFGSTSIGNTAHGETGSVAVYPNPAGAQGWTLAIPDAPRGRMAVTLLTPAGAVVRRIDAEHTGGAYSASLAADGLADGLYFVRVQGNGVQWSGRVMLQR